MTTIDVRDTSEVTEIIFAETTQRSTNIAFRIQKYTGMSKGIKIADEREFVVVHSKEHADNLIKALQEAVKQGWIS